MLHTKYSEEIVETMKKFYESLNERDRRRYAAVESIKLGHGGQKYIGNILGIDVDTIKAGTDELKKEELNDAGRVRKQGGGNKRKLEPKITEEIDTVFFEIIREHTAGSPMDEEIKWTNLTLVEISELFKEKGMEVSPYIVKQLLKKHKFVKRKMEKSLSMKENKDRNAQFEKIAELKEEYGKSENPIISIDVKKKKN